VTLADDLADTAAALQGGWPIDRLNRARRARTATMPDDKTDEILDRLTSAFNVVDGFDFTIGHDEDAFDVLTEIGGVGHHATELVKMLDGLAALLSDAGAEIARLNAECAGLRARCGK